MKIVYGAHSYALSDWIKDAPKYDRIIRVTSNPTNMSDYFTDDLATFLDGPCSETHFEVVMAAVHTQNSLLIGDDTTESQIATNCQAYVDLVKVILPHMIRAKYGRFVYLSSFRSVTPTKGAVLYGACKAFGEALFAGVAEEYGSRNIRANSLRLGYLDGGLTGPRPDDVDLLSPSDITAAISECLADEYDNGATIDLGDHR